MAISETAKGIDNDQIIMAASQEKQLFIIFGICKLTKNKTRNAARCNNRDDLANLSFILKVRGVPGTQSNIYDEAFFKLFF